MSEPIRAELLVARLMSEHEAWRTEALARLIARGAEAVPHLLAALQHASPAVRLNAVVGLGRIRDERAIPALVAALGETENHGAVAIAAERTLVDWGAPARSALLAAATADSSPVRPRALRALGRIGGEELEPVVRPLLSASSSAVRLQAAAALAAIAPTRAVEAISPLLDDDDPEVRLGVAEALVGLGSTRGEAVLQAAVADPGEQGMALQHWAEELLDQIDQLRRNAKR